MDLYHSALFVLSLLLLTIVGASSLEAWHMSSQLIPIVREADSHDASTIRRMVLGARLDPTQLRWQQFVVAELEGAIVGVGQLRRYGHVQELGSVVVVRELRGLGIGRHIVHALVERRDSELYLECRGSLASYYRLFGFRRVAWRSVPWPLKAKFALSALFSRVARVELAIMRFDGVSNERDHLCQVKG